MVRCCQLTNRTNIRSHNHLHFNPGSLIFVESTIDGFVKVARESVGEVAYDLTAPAGSIK